MAVEETPPVRQHCQMHEATEAAYRAAEQRAGGSGVGHVAAGNNKRKAQEEAAVAGLVSLARETEDANAREDRVNLKSRAGAERECRVSVWAIQIQIKAVGDGNTPYFPLFISCPLKYKRKKEKRD